MPVYTRSMTRSNKKYVSEYNYENKKHQALMDCITTSRLMNDSELDSYKLNNDKSKTINYVCESIIAADCWAGVIERKNGSIEVLWNSYDYDDSDLDKDNPIIKHNKTNRRLVINNTDILLESLNVGDRFRCIMFYNASWEADVIKTENGYSVEYKIN